MKKKEVTETIMRNKIQFSKILRKSCNLAASIIFCFFFVAGSYAQNPVSWSLTAPKSFKTGAKLEARLTANISGGWYLYSLTQPAGGPIPTRVIVASEPNFKLAGTVKAPASKVKFDESFGINTESYSGNIVFTIP